MWVVTSTFLACALTGVSAGLWVLGIWWRFALALSITAANWAVVAALLLNN